MEIKIKEDTSKKWHGTYRGVSFEIKRFTTKDLDGNEKYGWTHYIFIRLDRIPNKEVANSFWLESKDLFSTKTYDYFNSKWVDSIDFHGGCTWYSKESGFDGAEKIVKIGCDYQHSWDEGQTYSEWYVSQQVKETIESFRKYVPDYKYWCCGDGSLCDLSEGRLDENGSFYSYKYWSKTPLWQKLEKIESI